MLGAIFVGLSGMEAYSKGLKTISNNVANLDTLGYKSSTISFSDLFGGHASGLAYGSGQLGGSTGNGVRYNQERVDFKSGSFQQTGNKLDLSLLGNGFLVVQNKNGDVFYTRTGQFSVDSDGFISNQGGDRLSLLDAQGQLQTVNINDRRSNPPAATTTIKLNGHLNAGVNYTTPAMTIYDANGKAHTWTVAFTQETDTTQFKWKAVVSEGGTVISPASPDNFISFTLANGDSDPADNQITVPLNGTPVTLDFSLATTIASGAVPDLKSQSIDGRAEGTLTDVSVNDQGQVVLTYSNKETSILGSVAIADFQDQQSLVRIGGSLFKYDGTGRMAYKTSEKDGIGKLQTGQVEASNVDLTAEFGSLILIQRGFDASSQVISASNDMIQALFGMRGHG